MSSLADSLQDIAGQFSDASSTQELNAQIFAFAQAPAPPQAMAVRGGSTGQIPPTADQMIAQNGGFASVPGSMLMDDSVTQNQIGAGEITSEQLAELAVLEQNLADNSVSQSALQDSAVVSDKIAAGAVTALKIGAGEIFAYHINVSGLLAEQITAGTLSVGGLDGVAESIVIYDQDGNVVGIFDQSGFLFKDPGDTSRQMRFYNGTLQFSIDEGVTWNTAIDALGITADAISVGQAPGSQNLVPNASFEIRPFTTTATKVWTLAADWAAADTTIAALINIDTSTNDLKMTTVTY